MTTTTLSLQDPQFLATLQAVAAKAQEALPLANGRIAKAVEIVLSGGVTLLPAGHAVVASQSQPQTGYSVNGSCGCADAPRAPGQWCKHRLAVALLKRTQDALARPPEPTGDELPSIAAVQTPPPASALALPEAPASVNCYITVAGRQVQVTLRDTDETRVLQRLDALLQRYPVGEGSTPVSTTAAHQERRDVMMDWCPLHQKRMKRRQSPEGSWHSHRLADGAWCKGGQGL